MKRTLSLWLCLAAALASAPAAAQSDADRATARTLGRQGGEALKANDYAKALDLFSRAERLYKAPTLSLGRARALAGMGKLVSAVEAYRRIVHEGPGQDPTGAFGKAVAAASAEVAKLEPRLGGLVLTLQGPSSAQITLDGEPYSDAALGVRRFVDPGQHVIKAQADGYAPGEASFTVAEGGSASVTLRLERLAEPPAIAPPPAVVPPEAPAPAGTAAPLPPPGPVEAPPGPPGEGASTTKTTGTMLLGLGTASLLVGGVTGLLAVGKHSTLRRECPDDLCPPDQRSTLDQFHTFSAVSTLTTLGGAAALTAGFVLLASSTPKKVGAAGLWVGPGAVGFTGRF
jgi:hypothetical protein